MEKDPMQSNPVYFKSVVLGLPLVLIHTGIAGAAVRYVKTDGSTTSDCLGTWSNACTLQRALTASVAGDEIWVQSGLYKPHASNRSTSFVINKDLKVYGGFVGTETLLVQRPRDPDPFLVDPAIDSVLSGDLSNNDDVPSSTVCTSLGGTWTANVCRDVDNFLVRRDSENSRHVVTFSQTRPPVPPDPGTLLCSASVGNGVFRRAG